MIYTITSLSHEQAINHLSDFKINLLAENSTLYKLERWCLNNHLTKFNIESKTHNIIMLGITSDSDTFINLRKLIERIIWLNKMGLHETCDILLP